MGEDELTKREKRYLFDEMITGYDFEGFTVDQGQEFAFHLLNFTVPDLIIKSDSQRLNQLLDNAPDILKHLKFGVLCLKGP